MEEALEHGHVNVDLHGHKLHGGYLLQRTRKSGDKQQWLLIKRAARARAARAPGPSPSSAAARSTSSTNPAAPDRTAR